MSDLSGPGESSGRSAWYYFPRDTSPRDPKQFAKKSTDSGNVPEGELIMVGGNVVQRNSFKEIRNRMSQELVDITANTCTQALKKLFTEGYFENDEKTLEWLRPLISNYDAARQTISKG